jgi:hypothetical protein
MTAGWTRPSGARPGLIEAVRYQGTIVVLVTHFMDEAELTV